MARIADRTIAQRRKAAETIESFKRDEARRSDPGLEPDGGNLYRPHVFMIHSGQFWRCKHGSTGFGDGMKWVGCDECGAEDEVAKARFEGRAK